MTLDKVWLWLWQRSFIQVVHEGLLRFLLARLFCLLIQVYILRLDLEERGVFLLLLSFTIFAIIVFLMLLVMKCDGTFRNISSGALLGAWFALITIHTFLFIS